MDDGRINGHASFRALADSLPHLVWLADAVGGCEYVNRRWCEFTGLDASQSLAWGWLEAVHPDDRGPCTEAWARALPHGLPFEFEQRVRREDGAYRWFSVRCAPLPGPAPVRWFGTAIDIHEHKAAEDSGELGERERLRFAEERYRLAADAVQGLVYDWDLESDIVHRSPGLERLLGFAPADVPATAAWWRERVHPEDLSGLDEAVQRLAPGAERIETSYRVRHRDGRWIRVRDQAVLKRAADGRVLRCVGTTVDDRPRRAAELARHGEEERFRLIAETIPQLVWSARADGFSDYYNARFLEYLALDLDRMQGWSWVSTLHPDDAAPAAAAWQRAVATGEEYASEFRIRRGADGAYRWHAVRGVPLRDAAGGVVRWFGTCTDIDDRRRAEDALRESERRFRAMVQDAPVGVAQIHPGGRFLFANRAFCELLGYTAEELHEKRWQDVTHPADVAGDEDLAARAGAGEIPYYNLDKRYLRKDGSVVWVNLFANYIRDDAGRPVQGIAVVVDITARRLAEQRLAAVLASIDDHLVTYDRDWRYVYANEAAARTLGIPLDELIGARIWDLFPDAVGNQYWRELHRAATEQQALHTEHYYAPMDRWFENHIYPSADGVTVFASDITGRKRTERALRETERRFELAVATSPIPMMIHAEDGEVVSVNRAWCDLSGYARGQLSTIGDWTRLAYGERRSIVLPVIDNLYETDGTTHEGEFVIRTAAGEERVWDFRSAALGRDGRGRRLVLSIANDVTAQKRAEESLREADRRKDEFLALLAHELRNPLGPVRNAAHLLRLVELDDPVARQARDIIDRQVAHMARLVDDLLDVSRISRGQIHVRKEACDVVAVVRDTAGDYRALAEERQIALSLELPEGPLWIHGDAMRLAQAVGNLLHNATKFTERGGSVTVRAFRESADAVVRVEDTGIGMDAATLERLFQPFVQGDRSLDRAPGGLGLGLALVRGLMRLHGGTVEAHSEGPGRGASFTLRLPLVENGEAPRAGAVEPQGPGEGLRALIIEDNPDAAESLRLLLSFAGLRAEVAFDGPSGIERARLDRPDVIFCDLGLPGGTNGFEVVRELRSDSRLAAVRIVALSGYGQDEDRHRAREAGFDQFLVKPAEFSALSSILAAVPRLEP